MNPVIFRVVRLLRLLRLLRLVKTIRIFDALHLLMGALKSSWSILMWSFVILFVFITIIGLALMSLLRDFMGDKTQEPLARERVYKYFGTSSKCMLTLLEMTLGNWVVPARVLVEDVSEWYYIFVCFYLATVTFARWLFVYS